VPPIWPEPIKAILSRAMGNLSFEGQGGVEKKLDGWLSFSTDPFKSGYAQLSALP
jgi:hypothetical protein